jgi:hypothetical protein
VAIEDALQFPKANLQLEPWCGLREAAEAEKEIA